MPRNIRIPNITHSDFTAPPSAVNIGGNARINIHVPANIALPVINNMPGAPNWAGNNQHYEHKGPALLHNHFQPPLHGNGLGIFGRHVNASSNKKNYSSLLKWKMPLQPSPKMIIQKQIELIDKNISMGDTRTTLKLYISEICIPNTGATDKDISALVKNLKRCDFHLSSIKLQNNLITDSGIKDLFSAIGAKNFEKYIWDYAIKNYQRLDKAIDCSAPSKSNPRINT